MNKKQKTIVLVIGGLVAAYLIYKWYFQKSASGSPTGQLGTNLNSVAPELIGGSTGPNSGLNYYQGSTTIYLTENLANTTGALGNRVPGGKPPPLPNVNPGGPSRGLTIIPPLHTTGLSWLKLTSKRRC